MSLDRMTRCEQRTKFKVNGAYEWRWKEIDVADALDPSVSPIRCAYCHGRVRLHRQHVEHGPQDHVEHMSRADSEGCRGGHYFQPPHRMSSNPVTL